MLVGDVVMSTKQGVTWHSQQLNKEARNLTRIVNGRRPPPCHLELIKYIINLRFYCLRRNHRLIGYSTKHVYTQPSYTAQLAGVPQHNASIIKCGPQIVHPRSAHTITLPCGPSYPVG